MIASQAMIARAEEDGALEAGRYWSSSTRGAPARRWQLICVAKGYRLKIVTSNAFSQEKPRSHGGAGGGTGRLVESPGGLTTKQLFLDMIETARGLAANRVYVLDEPTGKHRQHRGLLPDGRGDLDADGRGGGCVRAERRDVGVDAGRRGAEAAQAAGEDRRRRTGRVTGAFGGSRARTRSRASGSATRRRCGMRA